MPPSANDELDAAALTRLWQARWPESPPVAQVLREAYADRWVRFHSLPGSKRYPENEAEEAILLHRHETVLTELSPEGGLLVLTTAWTETALPVPPPPRWPTRRDDATSAPAPAPAHWRTLAPSEDLGEMHTQLFFARSPWPFDGLRALLHAVAHEEMHQILLGALDLRWLYLPYDGGADIVAPSAAERDALKARHADWLSVHPSGY